MRRPALILLLIMPLVLLAGPTPHAGKEDGARNSVQGNEVQIPYMHVREHLARRDFDRAEAEVSRLLKNDPTSATLQLYETEIWIARADHHYDARRFRAALSLYEQVFRRWSSHPHVRARCLELRSNTDLRDEPTAEPKPTQPVAVERRMAARVQPASPLPAPINIYIVDPHAQATTIDVLGALKNARSAVDELMPKSLAPGNPNQNPVPTELMELSKKVERLTVAVVGIGALLLFALLFLASRMVRSGR